MIDNIKYTKNIPVRLCMKKQKKKQLKKKQIKKPTKVAVKKQKKTSIKVVTKKQKKTPVKAAARKVAVGNDEFCFNCMDWREYDDEGKCKVCRKQIKKKQAPSQKINYDEYRIEGVADEIDEEISETDFEG
jgi:hypothetical protein